MTTYTMTGPDGKDYSIDGPAGATQEQVTAQMQAAHANLGVPASQQYPAGDSRNGPAAVTVGPKPTVMEKLNNLVGSIPTGLEDIPQSAIEMGLKATDAVGLTNNRAPEVKQFFDQGNNDFTPGLASGSGFSKAGRIIGQTLGTLPVAGLTPLKAAGLVSDVGNAALQGGAAALGTSNSSDAPLWQQAGAGALGGGLMGGVIGSVGRGVAKAIAPPLPVADQGLQYVRGLMASSKSAPDAAGLRGAQTAAGGKPITSAEAIGGPAEVGIGALARRPGATADQLTGDMLARTSSAPQRILGDYATAAGIHPAAAQGNLDAFVTANQDKAAPLYKGAYAANQNVASPAIDAVLGTPAGKAAMRSAATNMQNDGVLMGVRDPDLLEQARDSGQEIPWKGGVASGLKLQSLDYIKRALDGQISVAQRTGDTAAYGPLVGLKKRLVSALDDADITAAAGPNSTKPEGGLYARARAAAGDYLGAQEQFQNGQDFILNRNVTPKQLSEHLADLGPADAEAFKGGVANKLFSISQNSANGKINPVIFSSPAVQQKLAVVLGPQKAATFLGNMVQEGKMAAFAAKRAPGAGSHTAEYTAAMADQDGQAGPALDVLNFAHSAATRGPVAAALSTGLGKIKDAGAAYLTRGMSQPVRDAAGNYLSLSPNDLASVFDSVGPSGLVGGGQLSNRAVLANSIRGNVNHIAPRIGALAPLLLLRNGSQ